MRGTKLTAWQIPPLWKELQKNDFAASPEGSTVLQKQLQLFSATHKVLTSIAQDVRVGLLETVGVASSLSLDDGRCSVIVELPENADPELIARAIDAENVEAWCDEQNKVHVAINPWYSVKDVDQTVLCTIKVIHVLLGIHASDALQTQPKTLVQKLLASVTEILVIQKDAAKKTD